MKDKERKEKNARKEKSRAEKKKMVKFDIRTGVYRERVTCLLPPPPEDKRPKKAILRDARNDFNFQ